ncbi:hypothetical protein L1887_56241 [Cichorium endivia]|nr:hypothetical protein L1887_56241 [Cichorium endivia]
MLARPCHRAMLAITAAAMESRWCCPNAFLLSFPCVVSSWWVGREAGSDDQHHTLVSPPDAEGIFVFDIWLASSTQLKPDAQIGRASLAHGTADGGATALSCDILHSLDEQIAVCCHANTRARWLAPGRAQLRAQAVSAGSPCEIDAAEAELCGSTSGARLDTMGGHAAITPPSALHIVKVLIKVSVYTSSCRIQLASVCSSPLRQFRHLALRSWSQPDFRCCISGQNYRNDLDAGWKRHTPQAKLEILWTPLAKGKYGNADADRDFHQCSSDRPMRANLDATKPARLRLPNRPPSDSILVFSPSTSSSTLATLAGPR